MNAALHGCAPIRIASLAAEPAYVASLVDAFATEWPEWAARTPRPERERCFECAPAGGLPQAFVAIQAGRAVGTISLRPWFGDEPIVETPWIRGLFVLASHRGRGIDRLLGRAAEDTARALGFPAAYCATSRIEALLLRRGWHVFRRVERDGESLAWLRKALRPQAGALTK